LAGIIIIIHQCGGSEFPNKVFTLPLTVVGFENATPPPPKMNGELMTRRKSSLVSKAFDPIPFKSVLKHDFKKGNMMLSSF